MEKRRKIADAQDAQRCLIAAAAAGLRPRDWARASGVDARSLNVWRVALERRAAKSECGSKTSVPIARSRPGLVEVVPFEPGRGPVPVLHGASARYVLDLDGVRIEFGDDFAESTLRRVMQALRTC